MAVSVFGPIIDNIISKSTDVEVIVITSSQDHKHALEAQQRGANSYFFKSENIKSLAEISFFTEAISPSNLLP